MSTTAVVAVTVICWASGHVPVRVTLRRSTESVAVADTDAAAELTETPYWFSSGSLNKTTIG